MPGGIDSLYSHTKNDNKASLEDRIRLYFLLKRINRKIQDGEGYSKKSPFNKIISIEREERKPNEKGIIHDYRYKVKVMYDKEIIIYIFYIENDYIKRIEYLKDGKYGGSEPIFKLKRYDIKQSRTINFSASGINIVHNSVATPLDIKLFIDKLISI